MKKTGVDVSKLPVAPKTPASPYSLFFKDFYGKNKGDFTDPATGKFKLAEASRAASLAWSKLSLVESDEFSAAYKSSHAAWTTKYREWYDALSKEDRKAIEAKTGKKLKVPGGKVGSRKAFRELPGNPGRPSSSFFEYLSEIKPELLAQGEREGLSGPKLNTYTAKAAGERWRQLSDADKAVSQRRMGWMGCAACRLWQLRGRRPRYAISASGCLQRPLFACRSAHPHQCNPCHPYLHPLCAPLTRSATSTSTRRRRPASTSGTPSSPSSLRWQEG